MMLAGSSVRPTRDEFHVRPLGEMDDDRLTAGLLRFMVMARRHSCYSRIGNRDEEHQPQKR